MDRSDVDDRLARFETECDAVVLCARDLGSRAWNLDDPASDRDVAFVFRQDVLDYVRLGAYRESVDREVGGHSFAGWNLPRFAELLVDSNPTALEFLNSDLAYRGCGPAWGELRAYANERFRPIALMGHYRGLARRNYAKYVESGDDPTVKRQLYVLRALLYARWVAETHRMPPLDFVAFVDDHLDEVAADEPAVAATVREYVREKKAGRGDGAVGNPLGEWVEAELDRGLDPAAHDVRGIETERVNRFVESCF